MKTFSINERLYKAKDIDYNMICDFEDAGISLEHIQEKPMSALRLYIAFCMNKDLASAGVEIAAHLTHGGTLEEVFTIFSEAMKDSSFFQAVSKDKEEEIPENTPKEGKVKVLETTMKKP